MSFAVRQKVATALAAAVALVGLLGSVVVAAPAIADPFTAVLDLGKTVDKTAVAPGQTFTYTLTPSCSSGDCLDATVVDTVPAEFNALTLNPTAVITGSPATYSWGGTNNRTLTVHFTTPAAGGGVELPSGDGPSIQFSLTVPGGLTPDWPSNGVPITNTADITASDAAPKSATATTTISIPYNTGIATTATWSPGSTQYKVDELSNLTIGVRNTSNAVATSLTAALPSDPTAAHSLVVVAEREKLPQQGTSAVFTNAMTKNLTTGLAVGQVDDTSFEAEEGGWYWVICGVPGHAIAGEWIGLKVDAAATDVSVKRKP